MHGFIDSVEFPKLKNYFIRKYSYCMAYEDIISLVNYAIVEGDPKYNADRSSYKTFVYKYTNWTIQKYIHKEVRYTKAKTLRSTENFDISINEINLKDELAENHPVLYSYFFENLTKEEISKKHKVSIRYVNKIIKTGKTAIKELVYNTL
jgi:hypothetical protein